MTCSPHELFIRSPSTATLAAQRAVPHHHHERGSKSIEMVSSRKRKPRRTETSLAYLNGVNRNSPRVVRRTTPRKSVFDIPDTPQIPAGRKMLRRLNETIASPNKRQERDIDDSPQKGSEEGSGRESTPEAVEQSDEAPDPSEQEGDEDEISESPRNDADEVLEDPFQGNLQLFSDGTEDQDESRESSPPGAQRELSSDSPSPDRADEVAVVIPTYGNEQQEDSDEQDAEMDDSSSSPATSTPEPPPVESESSRRLSRARAKDSNDEPEAAANEEFTQDDPIYEPENEDEEHDSRSATSAVQESAQNTTEKDDESPLSELRSWFFNEIEGSPAEKPWRTFVCEGKALRRFRERPMPEYLQGLRQLIGDLRNLYEDIIQVKEYSPAQGNKLWNLRESAAADIRQLFEYASENLQDASVLDQFEAHMIPRMVTLVLLSFRTFKIIGRLAFDQFYETLRFVLDSSVRVDDYRRGGYLHAFSRSRCLQLPLKRLMTALKKNRFGERISTISTQSRAVEAAALPPQPTQPLRQSIIPSSRVPWTVSEEIALLDGLQRYPSRMGEFSLISAHCRWSDRVILYR